MTNMPPPGVRAHYDSKCEALINYQICLELYASNVYESMASYFSSHMEALKPFAQLFLQQSSHELQHAHSLMWLHKQRGGHISQHNICRPHLRCWEDASTILEYASHLKITMNRNLVDLYQLASENNDDHLCNLLNSHYVLQQMKFIEELEDHISNLHEMIVKESRLAGEVRAKPTLQDSDKY